MVTCSLTVAGVYIVYQKPKPLSKEKWGGDPAHVIVGPGDWYSNFNQGAAPFSALKTPEGKYRKGIASVWIDGELFGSITADYTPTGQDDSEKTKAIQSQVEAVAL